ncbi:LamG-like jellyroll fold domain-containing protein [Azospirillum picis]|uniref:LamG domain-containing protein n=1 Tax=Azospirillum picis TaxID=488438 RepID=A0ABU0MED0_9PROT|nr:LamG-like jellyroll fold domain-containing protein [Azospirillum picis]MBP2297944.1 hypothetical protein [Azospirillum picis]MDQ0531782.1 hypothetical protein [Azospirillum picis]
MTPIELMLLEAASVGQGDPWFANVQTLIQPKATDTSISDYSSFHRAVTVSGGAAVSSSGMFTGYGGVPLDGVDDALSVSIPALGTQDFVAEAWLNLTDFSAPRPIFDFRSGDANGFDLYTDSNGKLYASRDGFGFGGSASTFPLGADAYVMAVRTGNSVAVFVNGVQVLSFPYGLSISTTTSRICWGSNGRFKGKLYAHRLTVGSNRGYTGSAISIPVEPWPTT